LVPRVLEAQMENRASLEKTAKTVAQESEESEGRKEKRGRQVFPILNLSCTNLL
jgi:hypothetical protein